MSLLSSLMICSPMAFANNGGTAFPICLQTATLEPKNIKLSEKLCILAASLGVIALFKYG